MYGHAFISIGDTHLGLKTDGIDRREEIQNIFKSAIQECCRQRDRKLIPHLVMGGDIFDDHDPSEDLIAVFIKILGWIREESIHTYIMVGNHEVVPDPERNSCLSFIRELKTSYPMIELKEKISTIKLDDVAVTFLPHITRATLSALGKEGTTQEYIEDQGKKAIAGVKKWGSKYHLVFSHLNVKQSKSGSEANLLKKSEAFLPLAFVNTPPGYLAPTIINFHIHERQQINNIHIVGSPLYCSFGETQEKTMTTVLIEAGEMNLVETPTPFVPFLQTAVEMIGETEDFMNRQDVQDFLSGVCDFITRGYEPVVKIAVTISAENNSYDWVSIASRVRGYLQNKVHLIPIDVKVVQKRVVRNIKQKPSLHPVDAVKVYLKANLFKTDENRAKRIFQKSKQYLEVT